MSNTQFQKNIKNLIDSFEKAREWADLNNCLQKLKRILEKNNKAEQYEINDKLNLAKRLAQCLSPDFGVIHKTTLDIYKMIFATELEKKKEGVPKEEEFKEGDPESIRDATKFFGDGLGVFLSGLFGFYQYAAFS